MKLLFFIILITTTYLQALTPKRFIKKVIAIGERSFLDIPKGSDLNISKRGIIDVQLYSGKVAITGLKRGDVMLTFSFKEDFFRNEKVLIHVENSNKKEIYKKIKNLPYELDNILDGFNPSIKVINSQAILINLTCGDNKISFFKELLKKSYDKETNQHLIINCIKKHTDQNTYKLSGKIILVKQDASSKLGVNTTIKPKWKNSSFYQTTSAFLTNEIKERRAKIIAEPSSISLIGHQTKMQSGFEELHIKTSNDDQKTRYIWKHWGLILTYKLLSRKDDKIRIKFDLTLTNPSNSNSKAYSIGKISSEVILKLTKESVVGSITLSLKDENLKKTPFLHELPILGPLMQNTLNVTSKTRVYLQLLIENNLKFN